MKKLLAMILMMMTILTTLPALAVDVEPNTMIAKIAGEMVTLYLDFNTNYKMITFSAKDEEGRTVHQIRMTILPDTKVGTYEGFDNDNVYEMLYNTDYTFDYMGKIDDYTQYMGGDYSGVKTIMGGSKADLARWQSNKGDIVLRLTKATGYRFIGEFSTVLHDTKRDELIPIQGKFDYTIGEKYEAPVKPRVDYELSLDDIDF